VNQRLKHIAVLGSTGSIGRQTLDVILQHPDRFKVVALAAGENEDLLIEQAKRFKPLLVSIASEEKALKVREALNRQIPVVWGDEGLIDVATHPSSDFVVTAIVGSKGLKPTVAAISAGKSIGLANKETLVSAGHIIMNMAREKGVNIVPIDSEHSAIFQCLNGENRHRVERIILTASGGALRNKTRKEMENVTIREVLAHPNWEMGAKITVDSATMMNKGLEVIEAHWLFSLPFSQIECLIHYESIIHSMVEFQDRSIMAQLGTPDMRIPIQYALSYPDRLPLTSEKLDLAKIGALHFAQPDFVRYPCLQMAYECGKLGGTFPCVLNGANEVAVQRFLCGEIRFLDIEKIIARVIEKHQSVPNPDLEQIFAADQWARKVASELKFS
jgi:1-deoxy-D-xylulose-5-phosphate reductoisomerase